MSSEHQVLENSKDLLNKYYSKLRSYLKVESDDQAPNSNPSSQHLEILNPPQKYNSTDTLPKYIYDKEYLHQDKQEGQGSMMHVNQ
jgi:hypothetical protein